MLSSCCIAPSSGLKAESLEFPLLLFSQRFLTGHNAAHSGINPLYSLSNSDTSPYHPGSTVPQLVAAGDKAEP